MTIFYTDRKHSTFYTNTILIKTFSSQSRAEVTIHVMKCVTTSDNRALLYGITPN